MPMKPINRLLARVYFVATPPKYEASVKYLAPTSHTGNNSNDNCVVRYQAINNLLSSLSFQEKIQVVLNRKGKFIYLAGTNDTDICTIHNTKPIPGKRIK
jgi:hypothetical protein